MKTIAEASKVIPSISLTGVCLHLALVIYSVMGWFVIGGYVPLYVFPVVIGVALLASQQHSYHLERSLRTFLFLLAAYTAWSIWVTALIPQKARPLAFSAGLLAGLGMVFFVEKALPSYPAIFSIFKTFFFVHLVGAFLSVFQMLTGSGFIGPSTKIGGRFPQPAGFEGLNFSLGKNYLPIVAFAIASIGFCLMKRDVIKLRYGLLWLLIGMGTVLISDSRSTQLATAIGIGLAVFHFRLKKLYVLIIPLLIGFAAVFVSSEKFADMFAESTNYGDVSTATRVLLWQIALLMFLDNPIMGVGGGNFRIHFDTYFPPFWDEKYDNSAIDPHNVFVGILTGLGIVGFVLFLAFNIYTLVKAKRLFQDTTADNRARFIGLVTYLYLIMFAVDSNFHNYFEDNNIWLFFGIFYAAIGLQAKARAEGQGGK